MAKTSFEAPRRHLPREDQQLGLEEQIDIAIRDGEAAEGVFNAAVQAGWSEEQVQDALLEVAVNRGKMDLVTAGDEFIIALMRGRKD